MRRPMPDRGDQHERQHAQADGRQFPVGLQHHEQQPDHRERLPHPVGQHVRGRQLDLFDVVHDGRHQAAGGVRFEERRILAQDAVEHLLAQVGDGRESDVINEVIAEIIADALDEEDAQQPARHHGPDVVDEAWDQVLEIELFADARGWSAGGWERRGRRAAGRNRKPDRSAAPSPRAPRRRRPSGSPTAAADPSRAGPGAGCGGVPSCAHLQLP